MTLADTADGLNLDVSATTLDESRYGLGFVVRGQYRGAAISGQGRSGSLLWLTRTAQALPFDLTLDSGRVHVAATGTLADPTPPAVFDMKLALAMRSMADMFPLTGVALPETPPLQVSGRLVASRDKGVGRYTVERFSGRVGGSDLAGTLTFALTRPRPQLTGAVHSNVLRFSDLGPAVGAGSGHEPATAGRVFPAEPFRVERLDAMDARVQFTAGQLARTAGVTTDAVNTTIALEAGVLKLDPLAFGLAGGTVNGGVVLDNREAELKTRVRAWLERIGLKKFLPNVPELHSSLGVLSARIDVKGFGNSVARLLGSASGDVQVLMNRGSFSKIPLEEAGLNVGNVVIGKLFGDRQIKLNCLAADFGIRDGIADTRTFLLDTEEARVPMTGKIDLRDERLDLTLRPEHKGLRVLTLRAPISVSGTFARPDVSVNKAVVAARADGALALGLLAPITAVLPLVAAPSAHADTAACTQALARASDAKRASTARQ